PARDPWLPVLGYPPVGCFHSTSALVVNSEFFKVDAIHTVQLNKAHPCLRHSSSRARHSHWSSPLAEDLIRRSLASRTDTGVAPREGTLLETINPSGTDLGHAAVGWKRHGLAATSTDLLDDRAGGGRGSMGAAATRSPDSRGARSLARARGHHALGTGRGCPASSHERARRSGARALHHGAEPPHPP